MSNIMYSARFRVVRNDAEALYSCGYSVFIVS